MRASVTMLLMCAGAGLASGVAAAGTTLPAALLGTWVQDQVGPVLTHERILRFNPNGSYEFFFTVRNTGSTDRTVLVHERGRATVREGRLMFTPSRPRSAFPCCGGAFPWRVDRDPYVGDLRLVLVMPDGILDVYYRR